MAEKNTDIKLHLLEPRATEKKLSRTDQPNLCFPSEANYG